MIKVFSTLEDQAIVELVVEYPDRFLQYLDQLESTVQFVGLKMAGLHCETDRDLVGGNQMFQRVNKARLSHSWRPPSQIQLLSCPTR